MSKKSVIICISALLLLMALVAVAVIHLYSNPSGEIQTFPKAETGSITGPKIFSAIPADAVIILHSRQFRTAIDLINDRTGVTGELVAGREDFSKFFAALKNSSLRSLDNSPSTVSLHYSGSLMPLLIVDIGSSTDTTAALKIVLAAAKEASLASMVIDCKKSKPGSSLLLVSPSETLITSSRHHIESGSSVYDKSYFSDVAPLPSGRVSLYIANDQANRVMTSYMTKRASAQSSFFSRFSSWTALSLDSSSEDKVTMQGYLVADDDPANFINIFRKSSTSDVQALEMLPASTVYAFGIASSKVEEYIDNYSRFLDAVQHLDEYKSRDAAFRSHHKMSAKQWASRLKIREVVKARFRSSDGIQEVLLLRVGKEVPEILLEGTALEQAKELADTICAYPYQGVTGLLFGKGLSLASEEFYTYSHGWLVVGSRAAVSEYVSGEALRQNLKILLGTSTLKDMNCFCYFSVTEESAALDEYFKPTMAEAIRESASGLAYEPMLFTIGSAGTKLSLSISRHVVIENTDLAVSRAKTDTTIIVPTGPFKVYNCGTKTDNLFTQNPNLSLTLSETSGKGIWSIPFKESLCGFVENVDFYKNDKIQFLFAAGSKLYLIDRLGRFVNGFPVELGKAVRLGPAVYDFDGSKDYAVVLLHKDNSIEMYSLTTGKKPLEWKSITAPETIKDLPELIEAEGKKYWIVRTAVQLRVYGFNGGEPVVGSKEGKTAIRPDSPLSFSGNTLTATCLDGKQRQFKLE